MRKKRVIVACNNGVATSQTIVSKLEDMLEAPDWNRCGHRAAEDHRHRKQLRKPTLPGIKTKKINER